MVRAHDMSEVSLASLKAALADRQGVERVEQGAAQRAAVAVVMRSEEGAAQFLMIRRALREGDPWSGHMAFPGGKREPDDDDDRATAERETAEELGIDLRQDAQWLGHLRTLQAISRGRPSGMVVTPVIYLQTSPFVVTLNHEVTEALWIPLDFFVDRSNRARMTWRHGKAEIELPCYLWQTRRIWGLSLRMIDDLLALVGR